MNTQIEKLQTLLCEDQNNFQARRELAIILADNGFNEEALNNLLYLNKYFPDDAELLYNTGILYEKLKNFSEAKNVYEKAIALSPQEDFYYNLGEVLVELKEWDNAIEMFENVLKTDSNDGNCFFNIGFCYFKKDELKLAVDNLQKATQLNPDDMYAYFYLGNIYEKLNLINFAKECYQKVLSISPDYSWAYYNLATISYSNNNLDEAKNYLLKTIEYNKNDIEAYKFLTKICIEQQEFEEILTILHEKNEQEENGDISYILAQVYRKINKQQEYADYLELALINQLSLTYKKDLVKKEYDNIINKLKNSQDFEDNDTEDEKEC